MPFLLSQFDLKPGVAQDRFAAAWADFADHLLTEGLATEVGPIQKRQAESGFDTDSIRTQAWCTIIRFRDQAQADAAWSAIEAYRAPLSGLHSGVFRLVEEPVFTFWEDH